MIPAPFEYAAPKTLEDALRLVERHGDEAKILAGGHSLLPLVKLRLAQPRYIIDIGRLKGLSYIRQENGHIVIGALTTHAEIESSELLRSKCPLLP
jgi:carbon-monoxide dehydrogenase medium subunit